MTTSKRLVFLLLLLIASSVWGANDFVAGVVKTADGKPAAGVLVAVFPTTSSASPKALAVTYTDVGGSFIIQHLTARRVRLTATSRRYGAVELDGVRSVGKGDLAITMGKAGHVVSGTFVDVDGKPLARLQVTARRRDMATGPSFVAETDGSGHWSMMLPDGSWSLRGARDAELTAVRALELHADAQVDIRLEKTPSAAQ